MECLKYQHVCNDQYKRYTYTYIYVHTYINKLLFGKAKSGISRHDMSEKKQEARARTRDEVGKKSGSRRRSEPVPLDHGCYTRGLPLRAPLARTLGAEDSSLYIYMYRV